MLSAYADGVFQCFRLLAKLIHLIHDGGWIGPWSPGQATILFFVFPFPVNKFIDFNLFNSVL